MVYKIFLIILLFSNFSLFAERKELNIASFFHITGEWAPQGKAFLEGVQLAIETVNARSGSVKVNHFSEDTQYKSISAVNAAKKLLATEHIDIAFTTTLTEARVLGPLFQKEKIPLLTLWDSSPELEAMGKGIFAIGTWAPSSGSVSAEFAHNKLSAKTAIIINSETSWSKSVSDAFHKEFTKLGGKILETFSSLPTEIDYKPVLLKALSKKPEVIYTPLDGNLTTFYKQRKELRIEIPTISSDVIANEQIKNIPNELEGIYQSQTADPESKGFENFRSAYKRKFAKDPEFSLFSAWGYDGVMIAFEAFKNGYASKELISDYFYEKLNYSGLIGQIKFNKFGSFRKKTEMFQMRDGKFVRVR